MNEEAALGKGDKGKGVALVATLDAHMVVVYKSGLIEKYTELGCRVWATRIAAQVSELLSFLRECLVVNYSLPPSTSSALPCGPTVCWNTLVNREQ